jgi:Tol biopolymer transport system component/DNA-binding winged helix-turn-helix (wHTH) protein
MVAAPRYTFGGVELDTGRVLLLRADAPVTVEPKAFAVLQLLVERAPQVVEKAEIFAVVWKDTAVTDNALTRIIAQLRRAMGDDARDPRYIATVSARGYRLLPDVRRLDGQAPPAAAPATAVTPSALVTQAVRQGATSDPRWLVAGAVAALVLISIVGAYVAVRHTASAAAAASMAQIAKGSLGDLDLAVAASLGPEQLTAATGYDGYVAYSPDSATIAYSSDRSGALEIYVEGLAEGSSPTSLTRGIGHQAIQPAWSPDGRLIAYAELAGNGIWIVPSRGGTARKITEFGAHPTWAPDGRRIAFQSRPPADLNTGGSFGADSTIWLVDVDGRTPPAPLTAPGRPVGSHGAPQWMPSTGRVLFAVAAPAGVFLGAALWTVDPDTKALRLMSAHPRLTSEFVVAPDARGVLFAARDTNALWWLPIGDDGVTAGEPRPTALPVTGPSLANIAVSRDGRRVAWTAGTSSSGIWAAAAGARAGTAATSLVAAAEIGSRAGHPAVSPDGRIAFMGDRGHAGNKIFLVEPGRPPRQLTTDARDHFSPFWLRGENALAVLANHGDGVGWWRLDPATGREQLLFPLTAVARPPGVQAQVVGPAAGMAISSDLRRLAVAYVRDGVPNLWTTALGPHGPTGPLVQRTFETIGGAFGAWSPDGSWLAYQCGRGGDTQLCVVGADGQAPGRQLTSTPGTNFIGEWTDDDAILFAAKDRAVWNIRSVARESGKVATLTSFVEPRFYVRYARWDAPNRRVVFERWETTGRLWSVRIPEVTAPRSPARGSSR